MVSKAQLKSLMRNSESMKPSVLTSALLQAHCSSASTLRQPYFSPNLALQRLRFPSLSSSSLTLHRPYSVPTSARLQAYFTPPPALQQPYDRPISDLLPYPTSAHIHALLQPQFSTTSSDKRVMHFHGHQHHGPHP